ncbi:MAG: tetratricopeptide repeat protein, partial [Phenylobacterium sp.]|nr:tetratricopeptide repeat protein [Phenylobacterium sp.]
MSPLKTFTLLTASFGALVAGSVQAASLPEVFSLGQSGASGAICEAVRDYQDPMGQGGQARAWRIRCRGYSTGLGRIYQLPAAQTGAWREALSIRAQCAPGEAAPGGLPGTLAACRLGGQEGAPYVVFTAEDDGALTVVEGLAPLSDVLETGLKVALGLAKAPASTEIRTSAAQAEIAADFPNMSGLAAAEAAAAADPDRLRARGYVQNNEWRFDEAETAFRALVTEGEARNAPAALRAEATLNLAMNISNSGRFEEAEAHFSDAQSLIPPEDILLRARSLNYLALHARNRGQFEAAIGHARGALSLRAGLTPGRAAGAIAQPAQGGPLVIDAGTARRLNTPSAAQSQIEAPRVSPAEQLAIQDAQAWQVIGTSLAAQGKTTEARTALLRAQDILTRSAALGRLTAWLQSRVIADLAELDLRDGRADQAAVGYERAIGVLRTRHAGSTGEGALLLDLGR